MVGGGRVDDPLYGIILHRASVKLFELGVRTAGGLFWAYGMPRVSIFGVFVRQARHNLRPTPNDEDVKVVLDIKHIMSTQILTKV